MIANLLLKNGENAKLYSLWWGRLGSNQRPIGYEPTALTPELRPRSVQYIIASGINYSNLPAAIRVASDQEVKQLGVLMSCLAVRR